MLSSIAKFVFHRLMGWELEGKFPNRDKFVVIVVPHTHWMDFIIGILVRSVTKEQVHYVAKKSLFRPPYGWFFRYTGGTPVDREKNSNMVDSVVKIFEQRKKFRLCLAPEGTRKKVDKLKTGFYYIAKNANVPIIKIAFDFGKKKVAIAAPFWPTQDMEADMEKVRNYYKGVTGKIPQYSFGG